MNKLNVFTLLGLVLFLIIIYITPIIITNTNEKKQEKASRLRESLKIEIYEETLNYTKVNQDAIIEISKYGLNALKGYTNEELRQRPSILSYINEVLCVPYEGPNLDVYQALSGGGIHEENSNVTCAIIPEELIVIYGFEIFYGEKHAIVYYENEDAFELFYKDSDYYGNKKDEINENLCVLQSFIPQGV